jgi:hypothetical protein
LLGLLQGIRLTNSTARFADSGPLRAYIDVLKGPLGRAIEICPPEQSFDPPDVNKMKSAFFQAAFQDEYVESLSENELFEVVNKGAKPYLLYKLDNRINFHIRFGCYCGETTKKTSSTYTEVPEPWSNINLTDPRMKPGFVYVQPEVNTFP